MLTKIALPIVAFGLLVFAVLHVRQSAQAIPEIPPPIEPARNPFARTVAAAGMVEPESENIAIGSPIAGIVAEVFVKVGQQVQSGTPLLRLDDRELQAELRVRQAVAGSARANLARLDNEPRPEKLRMAQALLNEALAKRAEVMDRRNRVRLLSQQQAVTQEEIVGSEQLFQAAEAQVARARADLEMTQAGAWEFEKLVARASVDESESRVRQTETELERLVIAARDDGEVLQVKVRPGEFVGATVGQTLIMLGHVVRLHVRADIDEYDIPRFKLDAPATATLKGQPATSFRLSFVRVEPFVIPKRSLTGENTERVDTRVLQVIYALAPGPQPLYVGQQLDVSIDASDRLLE